MAKIYPEKLEAELAKQLAPIYIVSGDEPLQVMEACDAIRKHARQSGFVERQVFEADRKFQWGELHAEASSISLFADKKILEIHLQTGKPGDAGSKAFVEYCDNLNDDTLLLVVSAKIDKRSQSTKWFKALEKVGVFVEVWPIKPNQMNSWLLRRCRGAGLNVDSRAIEALAAKVEGNLLAATQEVEKLKLLAVDGTVTPELMNSVVTDSSRYDVFTLIDRMLAGDAKATLHTLNGLQSEGVEPAIISWAVSKEIRTINAIAEQVDRGQRLESVAKSFGIWSSRVNIVKAAVNRLNAPRRSSLLRQAANIDKTLKGNKRGDVWTLLKNACLDFAGVAPLSMRSIKVAVQSD